MTIRFNRDAVTSVGQGIIAVDRLGRTIDGFTDGNEV